MPPCPPPSGPHPVGPHPDRGVRWRSGAAGVALVVTALLVVPVLAAPSDAPQPGRVPGSAPPATLGTVRTAVRVVAALRDVADALRPPDYRLPVDAPVVRPFVPPSERFGPGHRGVDLAASPGAAVRAAERGVVAHAGPVVDVSWVVVAHRDGVRTSYGPLVDLVVAAGDDVEQGDVLGRLADRDHGDEAADTGLHLGARRGDDYVDPMGLPGLGPPRPTLVGDGGWWGADHAVTPYAAWSGGRLGGLLTTPSPDADRPGFAVPPNPNHLVLVAGLSSTSDVELVDPSHLGIDPDDATRFSYAGTGAPYDVTHTWHDVDTAARRLAAQLRAQARREPGRAVDLIGHSLGGVVIAHYLLHLHDPFDPDLPPVGHVVTVASPLQGSDLARAGVALVDGPASGPPVRGVWGAAGALPGAPGRAARSLDPDAPALHDIATGSDVLTELAARWEHARARSGAGPLATGTRVLNVVASLDGLVGADRAALEGAERRVLPGTHAGVLDTEALREVVWRFLAGREVVRSPGGLTTAVGSVTGDVLTAVSVLAGDVDAAHDLPLVPLVPTP